MTMSDCRSNASTRPVTVARISSAVISANADCVTYSVDSVCLREEERGAEPLLSAPQPCPYPLRAYLNLERVCHPIDSAPRGKRG